MALSEIIINDAVQYQTDAVISEANYQILRQYLLERTPLSPVISAVQSLVANHCITDKQDYMHRATQQACEAQKSSDEREERADHQEKQADEALQSQYTKELRDLQSTLSQLELKREPQELIVRQIQSQIDELTISLRSLNTSIDRIQNERALLNYTYPPVYPANNVHVHGHFSTMVEFPNAYATPHYDYGYTLQTELRWMSLSQEENRLKEDRSRLNLLINSRERECNREERTLDAIRLEQRKAEQRNSELRRQLDTILPNRESQRQSSSQWRAAREQARHGADPDLRQLTAQSKEQLSQRISTKNAELNDTQNKLLQRANELSYSVYLTQLGQVLERTDYHKLSFTDRYALKAILETMHSYNDMEKRAQKTQQTLDSAQSTLQKLRSDLEYAQQQVQHYSSSKPEIERKNQELKRTNERLAMERYTAENDRSSALNFALIGLITTLSSGLVVTGLIVNPLFFIIPGVLALGTLISLIVAAVYHVQKSGLVEQFEANRQTIFDNETTLEEQDRKAENINTCTIPTLQAQIKAAEQNCRQIDMELKSQQHSMSQLLGKAHNITNTYGGSSAFFGESAANTPLYPFLEQPSAPEYDVDLLLNYGGQPRG
jgi:hypothetical protein